MPLNQDALRILCIRKGQHSVHVFGRKGAAVVEVNTAAWKMALKRASIENFRWHDLRHTWASWHVQNGTPLQVLQELGGWESPEMVRCYAHFFASHLAAYVEKLPTSLSCCEKWLEAAGKVCKVIRFTSMCRCFGSCVFAPKFISAFIYI